MNFDVKNKNVELTAENLAFYSKKLIELNVSLKDTLNSKYPQDALSIIIQIDDVLDIMKKWTSQHVTEERLEKHWSASAKIKAHEM